jgi:hypothetical protein
MKGATGFCLACLSLALPAALVAASIHMPPIVTTVPATTSAPAPAGGWGSGNAADLNPMSIKDKAVLLGPVGCPIVLIEDQPYDCATLEPKGTPLGVKLSKDDFGPKAALSPDGKMLALESSSEEGGAGGKKNVVALYSIETGKKVQDLPLGGPFRVVYLAFADGGTVLIAVDNQESLLVVSTKTGKPLRSIKTGELSVLTRQSITADGKYLAVKNNDGILVYDISNGKAVAQMAIPTSAPGGAAGAANRFNSGDKGAFLSQIDQLAFSPTGTELAAYNNLSPRTVVWNQKGAVVFDEPMPKSGLDHSFVWLPDGSGWMLGGQSIYLKESRQVVMTRPNRGFLNGVHQFLSRDKLLSNTTTDNGVRKDELVIIDLPWAKVDKTLAAMKAGNGPKAVFKAGDTFGVKIEMANLKGAAPQGEITRSVSKALTRAKMKLSAGDQPFMLMVKYSEKDGPQMHVMESQRPGDLRGKDTGQVVASVEADIAVNIVDSSGKTLWSKDLHASPSTIYDGPINDQTVRASLLEDVQSELEGLEIPAFLSNDPSLVSLPVKLEK